MQTLVRMYSTAQQQGKFTKVFLVLLLVIGMVGIGRAQSTWLGGTSTAWSNTANWSPASVPASGASTNVIINSGTFAPTLPSNYVLGSLTINAGATLNRSTFTLTVASLSGSGNINGSGLLTIGTATNASSQFDGIISGTAGLTKAGTGTLTLGGANTYSGATTLNAGAIKIGASTATLGSGNTVNITGILDLNGNNLEVGAIAGAGTIVCSGGSGVLTTGGNGATTSFTGLIKDSTGNIGLTKTGAGTLTLSGSNSYTGVTTITAGVVSVGSIGNGGVTGNLGAATNAEGNLVLSGGTLSYTGAATSSDRNIVLTGTGSTLDMTNALTLSGVISSTGTLTKTGAGTLTLTGTNTFSGTATISAGTLSMGNASALGTNSATTIASGATVDLNGNTTSENFVISGSLVNSSATAATVSGDLTLTTAAIIGGSGSVTASGVISGSGTLTKSGAGTWTLNGDNTYTAATTVSAGNLKLGHNNALGTTAGGTTIAASTVVDLNGVSSPENYTLSGSLVNNNTGADAYATGTIALAANTAVIGGTGNATSTGVISGTFNLQKSGAGIWALSGANTFTGAMTIATGGTLKVASSSTVLGSNSAFTVTGTLDLNGNDAVVGSITGAGSITNYGASPATLTTGAKNTNTTFSGILSNGNAQLALTKVGTGTLTLSGNNSFTGTTAINAGTLTMGHASALGGTSTTSIASGATLELNGFGTAEQLEIAGSLLNTSTTSVTLNGTINLTGAAIIGGSTGGITISGVISGSGSLTKNAAFTLTLSGSNTYTGNTSVTAGALALGNSNALGSTTATNISGSGAVDLNGFSTAEEFNANGIITNSSATAATASGNIILTTAATFAGTGNVTVSGVISGTGTLAKNEAGTWTLSGNNTFTGATTVNAGTLKLGHNNGLGSTTGNTLIVLSAFVDLNGFTSPEPFNVSGSLVNNSGTPATASGNITLTTAAILGGTGTATASGVISGSGTLAKNDAGAWILSGTNTFTAATTVNGGTIKAGAATTILGPVANSAVTLNAGTTLDLNGYSIELGSLAGAGSVTSNTAGSVSITTGANNTATTFSGIISDGSGQVALIKKGTAIFTVSGANVYSGTTTVMAGTIKLGNVQALGTTTHTTIQFGATVDLAGLATTEPFTISGSLISTGGTFTISGNLTLNNAAIIGGTGNVTASGIISGTGTLQKTGTGTWTLTGTNTYSGATTVTTGTLKMGSNDALGTTTATTISSGAILDLNGFSTAEPFTISGTLSNNGATASSITAPITLSTAAIIGGTGNVTASGIIGSTGTLQKTGTGTWTLTGNNNYSGTTTVSTGTLKMGSNSALGTTSATTISSGATLELDGYTTAEPFTISGSLLNNNATDVTLSGAFTLTGTAILGGSGNITASGIISSTGALQKTGSGTLTLTGTNTYTGATTVSTGTLKLGNNAALGTNIATTIASGATVELNGFTSVENFTISGTLSNNSATNSVISGTLANPTAAILTGTGNVTASGVMSGAGTLQKTGTGAWTLSGANTFTGITTVSTGTLKLGNNTALGTTTATTAITNIASGATVDLNGFTSAEPFTLSGSLVNNSSTAATASGTISLSTAGIIGGAGNATLSGVISGSGTLQKTGTSTWTLSAANTYSGTSTISAGTVKLGNKASLGSTVATTIAAGATVDINAMTPITELFTVSGSLVNNGGTASVVSSAITLSGAPIFGGTGNTTLSGVVSSTGSFTKTGTGTFTLSGTNTFTGGVNINAGTVSVATIGNGGVSGNLGASSNAASNLVLGGGQLTYSGATASTDRNITLTANTVSQINISTLATTLTVSGTTASTSGGFTKEGPGTLVFSGTNQHTGITYVNAGTLNSGGGNTTVAAGQTMYVALGQTITIPAGSTLTNNGTVQVDGTLIIIGTFLNSGNISGTGTYQFSGTSAQTIPGALTYPNLTLNNTVGLTLGGATTASGTLTISASNNLQLAGYNLTVNSLIGSGNIANTGSCAIITVNGSSSTTYSGIISGCTGLTKSGTGVLTLSGTNTYTGVTTIAGGSVSVATIGDGGVAGNLGQATNSASNLVLSGGTLSYTGATASSDRSITLTGGSSAIEVTVSANTLTLSGVLGSTGSINKTGAGSLVLTGTNTYTGATTITAGTLSVGTIGNGGVSGNIGAATNAASNLILSGGTLLYTGVDASTDRNFVLTSGTSSTINVAGNTLTWNGSSTSTSGAIVKAGAGTLEWKGTNLYSGLTTISAGILKLGSISAFGTTAAGVSITSGAALDLNGQTYTSAEAITINGTGVSSSGAIYNSSSAAATYGGLITLGSASSIVAETGTIALTNAGTITGAGFGLTLSGSQGGSLQSILGTGAGTLTKLGTGTWTISGANTYSGVTSISAGILKLGSTTALGTTGGGVTVAQFASLDLNGQNYTNSEPISINGTGYNRVGAILNSSPITATYGGQVTLINGASIVGETGSINISNTGAITGAFVLTLDGTQGGTISSPLNIGAGTLTKIGTGTWKIAGNGTYTGATLINEGTLKLGASSTANSGPLGTSAGTTTISSGAVLDFNGFSLTSASVEQIIPNGTGISSSGAIINSSTTASSFAGTINSTSGTAFSIGGVGQITFSGIISGDKNITKTGTNTVVFTAANTYTGSTTISQGTLSVPNITLTTATSGALGNNSSIVLDGGNLQYTNITGSNDRPIVLNAGKNSSIEISTAATSATLSGVFSGGGSLTKKGAGTLILTGVNTFTGSTTVAAGTLSVGSIGASGVSSNAGAGSSLVLSGGTLIYTGASTATSDRTISLSTGTISTIKVTTSAAVLTLSGEVSGSGAWKIANAAASTLVLTGSNSYTGATTLTSGILKINTLANGGSNSSIGASSSSAANLVFTAGILSYTGFTASTDRNFTLGTGTINFDIQRADITLTISGSCGSATGSLTKSGAGTLALTGTNRYTGTTTLSAGVLSVNSINNGGVAGSIGAATTAAGKLVFGGGTLSYTGNSTSTNRNFSISAGVQATIDVPNASTNLTWTGASTTSTGGLTKTGLGTLTLAGNSAYTGITYINAGTVKLGNQFINVRRSNNNTNNYNQGPLGTGGGNVGLTTANGTVVAAGATLDYNGYPLGTLGYVYNLTNGTYSNRNYYENISISGNGVGDAGAIINSSSKAITSGYSVTYLDSAASIGGVGAYPLTYYSGTTTLTKKGNNTVTFNSNSTVTGNIVIESGILKCAATSNVLGSTTGTTTVSSGGTLDLNGLTHNIAEPLVLNGSGYNNVGALYNGKTGAATFTGAITLGSEASIGGLGNITLSGTIGGTGNLVKIGTKQLTLSAATTNTYSGSTTISGGILSVANFANLGTSGTAASNLVFNGGTLLYTGTTTTFARSFTVADGTNNIFQTNAASTNVITLTGSSTGGGNLSKAGPAAWLVQGTLNHTGGTKDSTGVLELANTNGDALSNTGTFNFGGGTLKTKSGGANETAGSLNLSKSSAITFGSTSVAHSLNFADSKDNLFTDGKILSITNWVKSTRNADSSFNSGAAGKIFVGTNGNGLTKQQRGKIRFTINTNIATAKYLTFPGVYNTGSTTTLKKFYSLSAEQLSTGELVPAVPRPILDIQGTDGLDTICINQSDTFNYTLYNIGDVDAANVNIVSDNPNFVVGALTGATTVTGVITVQDTTTSTPGSTITFPVVFNSGSTPGIQTVHLITSSTTPLTDNDTLTLQFYVTGPPTFSASNGGACYSDQFATLTASSTGGSYITWHTSATPTAGDTAYIGNPFIIDPLTASAIYYAQANLGTCVSTGGRTAVTATLNTPASTASIAANITTICNSGTTKLSVSITGGLAPYTLIYNDGTNDIMVPNYNSGDSITVSVSSSTTFSIVSLTDALGCDCEDISSSGTVSVDVISSDGGIPEADIASICPGETAVLTLFDYDGSTFQWQQSTNGTTGWTNVSGGTNATTDVYTTAGLTATTYFRAAVTNSTCAADYSDVIPVTVNASVGGSINNSNICAGNTTSLTLTGYSGDSFLWQQSDDNTNFEQVSGGTGATSNSFTTPTLYATKYYKVIVTNGTCPSAASSSATVTVSPASVAGTIDATNATVCTGTNSNTLTLSNYVGSIQWQSSSSINGTYANISGATSATLALADLTASTYYRAVVTSGTCTAAISDPYLVTVSPASVPGSVSGGGVVCSSSNASTLTLSGATGTIQWQVSTDYGITYSNISGATSTTYDAGGLSQTTYYQAVVTSGACSSTTTEPVSVDVTSSSQPTTIGGTTVICVGENTTLTTSSACENSSALFTWYAGGAGNDAYDQGWESTSAIASSQQVTINNNSNGILNITSTNTDAQLSMTSLGSFAAATYKYINMRYRVTAGTGGTAEFYLLTSSFTTPSVSFMKSASLVSDNQWHTVSIDISTMTANGAITGWRFDPTNNNGVTMDIDYIQVGTGAIVGTGSSITVTPSATTTYYVNKNGYNISTDFISELVTVNAKPTPTFTSQPGVSACINTEVSYITQTGKTNYVWTLPGTSGTDYTIVSGGSSSDYSLTVKWLTTGNKTVTLNYTQGCAADAATSSTATTVGAASVGGTASATNLTICTGSTNTVTLSGHTGSIQWLSSPDGINDWALVSGGSGATTSSYTTASLSATGYFRAAVSNGVCAADSSSIVTIAVAEAPTSSNAGPDQNDAATCGLTTVTLAGNAPSVGTGAWSIISGTGGSIASTSNEASSFSGVAGSTYTLRWTISNSPCSASTDDVVVAFNQAPSAANAGPDQTSAATCGLTTVTLAGNTPSIGTGAWSIVSGTGGSLADASSASSAFSGVAGSTYTLRWTISNNPCTASTDDVVVTFNQNPTIANAGPDQNRYSGSISATLAANTPTDGTGVWSIVSGSGGTIATASDPASGFTGSALTAYTLRWTISNSICSTSDDVVISSGHVWTGLAGDDLWSNGNNWSPGTTPVTGSHIIINLGTPHLDTDFSVAGTLSIGGTGTLNVDPGNTLSIANGGVADFGGKLVTFKSNHTGSGQLGVVAGTLSNATNVTVERFIPNGKRAFRLFGSPVTTTTTIRQNWMENAVPGILSGYPYTTASIHNPHPGYGTQITGPGGVSNGFDATLLNNASLFRFNNSTGAWAMVTNTTGTIAAGSAYRMLVRGDRGYNMALNSEPAGGSTTLRTNGTIAQGELTTGVELPALNQDADGWSLVGNPYQSVVDMYSSEVVKNNLTNYYYIWDPRQGTRGAYVAYNMNLATGGSNNISSGMTRFVQPGQAFFVQNTTAGGNSLVFREAAKGHASNRTSTFGEAGLMKGQVEGYTIAATEANVLDQTLQPVDFSSLSAILYYTDSLAIGRESMDATRVLFGKNFSNNVDANDGEKFTNLDETMSIKRGDNTLSMELRSNPDANTLVPLNISQYRVKRYTMRLIWDQPLNDDTLVAYLKDNYLNREIAISKTGNTDVAYVLDGQPASSAANRFELVFKSTAETVAAINGNPQVCVGTTSQMTDATKGGSWSTADSTIATVDGTGAVKGVNPGTTEITYSVPLYGSVRMVKQLVTVNALPEKPVITRDVDGNLISNFAVGNQWYLNNEPIAGAVEATYKPATPAYYKVKVVENGCISEMSNSYYYTTGPLLDVATGSFVRIFPNPAQTEVRIEYMLNDMKTVAVHVYDMKGNRVLEYKELASGSKINLMGLANGVYRFWVMNLTGLPLYSYTVIKN